MTARVIVLNGASSAGKSTIARALQDVLADPWLTFGIDTLVDALPASLAGSGGGLDMASDGTIAVGPEFRRFEEVWYRGLAAMVDAGARMIVDDVFLGGAESQQRVRRAFEGLDVLWVGVRCSLEVAASREAARGDRVVGQAAAQAVIVHDGVHYDLEVDTTATDPRSCAEVIAARLGSFGGA